MKVSTISLSLPKGLLGKVDREAGKEDRGRSELMRVALRAYLNRKAKWGKIFVHGDKLAKKRKLKPTNLEAAITEIRNYFPLGRED